MKMEDVSCDSFLWILYLKILLMMFYYAINISDKLNGLDRYNIRQTKFGIEIRQLKLDSLTPIILLFHFVISLAGFLLSKAPQTNYWMWFSKQKIAII